MLALPGTSLENYRKYCIYIIINYQIIIWCLSLTLLGSNFLLIYYFINLKIKNKFTKILLTTSNNSIVNFTSSLKKHKHRSLLQLQSTFRKFLCISSSSIYCWKFLLHLFLKISGPFISQDCCCIYITKFLLYSFVNIFSLLSASIKEGFFTAIFSGHKEERNVHGHVPWSQ